jgi:Rieske Fe-S protein
VLNGTNDYESRFSIQKKLRTNKEENPMMQQDPSVPRRRFIKQFVVGTAFSVVAGRGWLGTLVADCTPTAAANGILRVNISDFPALQADNGSVRLLFNPINASHFPTNQAFYPVLINRAAAGQFFALNSRCMHQSCVVPTFNTSLGASECPCHGSRYAIDGAVLRGPTLSPLAKFKIPSFDGAVLCIEIPNLGYSVTGSNVQNSLGPRFSLQFPTKSALKYEVRFRQSAADPGTIVPFSTTDIGAATATVFTGNNSPATLYVDRTTEAGIYSVNVQANVG